MLEDLPGLEDLRVQEHRKVQDPVAVQEALEDRRAPRGLQVLAKQGAEAAVSPAASVELSADLEAAAEANPEEPVVRAAWEDLKVEPDLGKLANLAVALDPGPAEDPAAEDQDLAVEASQEDSDHPRADQAASVEGQDLAAEDRDLAAEDFPD